MELNNDQVDNKEYINKFILSIKIKELEKFLNDTQFKFGEDYDFKYTPEWEDLKIKRQEAREFIRANEGDE